MKYLDQNGLLYIWNKIKSTFVEQEAGKGLSTNDLTDELKAKILSAGTGTFDGDYNSLTNKPTIPSKTSDLTNDSGFQTASDVSTAISGAGFATTAYVDNKIVGAYKYKGSVASASALPTSGQAQGDVYNLEDTGMNTAWDGTKWDNLGSSIDLSGYVETTDLVAITNSEIDTITA